ncbi:DUF742 domain-containing protein [Streptomyces niger]|uniref:DUF742 domain-containing protein n=1 Tax=Streptomyces niger TaxID=66373 RepID=UPI00069B690A|nr:DUF742 domain-containing protein [Streptomyces niger]
MKEPKRAKPRPWEEGGPDRLYLLADDRNPPEEPVSLDVVTLIVSRSEAGSGMEPERASIVGICGYPLSVAEISAYLRLPVSAVIVLLTDLLTSGHVEARASIPARTMPDVELLEAVMHGLQNL